MIHCDCGRLDAVVSVMKILETFSKFWWSEKVSLNISWDNENDSCLKTNILDIIKGRRIGTTANHYKAPKKLFNARKRNNF